MNDFGNILIKFGNEFWLFLFREYLYSTAVQSSQAKFIATKNATFMQNLQCQCNNFSYTRLDFHQKIGMIINWIQSFRWQGIFGKPEILLKFVHNKKVV
jgi:hypothetical protein